MRMRLAGTAAALWLAASWLPAEPARAQVVEPNGLAVPVLSASPGERSVQAYFDGLTPPEPIDALQGAGAEPSTFSPLCGFEAELVLSESQSPGRAAASRATPACTACARAG
jgi:hypothetical protein